MFEADINIAHPEPTLQTPSFNHFEATSFAAPTPLTQVHEPLSFAPPIASLENFDSSILQLQDVITIDKSMLDKATNAISTTENDYFDDQSLISQIHQQKTHHEPFITFDLGLSEKESEILDAIEINKTDEYNNFGKLENLKQDLPDFLRSATTADESQISVLSTMIEKLTTKVVSALDGETAWFALRAYTPTHKYDIPRWHTDYHFTAFGSEHEVKFVTALKGDQTLLYPASAEERAQFIVEEHNRDKLNELFQPTDAISAKPGHGVIFVVGDPSYSAIHSEPKTDKNRLFLSVVVGNHSKVKELDERWNKT